ncbi:hypothetical protein MBOL_34370 [Mycobacteroides abscessus subsp. bolletii BD]|nr:hypothetical protein MBOL_34370 [Mycobacteroides abscessus subsp. bolletii BD]
MRISHDVGPFPLRPGIRPATVLGLTQATSRCRPSFGSELGVPDSRCACYHRSGWPTGHPSHCPCNATRPPRSRPDVV